MKIIKVLEKTELVIVDLEVNLGKEKRNGLTLCVKYNGEYYPLNTAPITFHNPIQEITSFNYADDDIETFNFKNTNKFSVKPESKTLLLFPSYLYHQIMEHDINTNRLSLAFNIMPNSEFGSMDSYFDPRWFH